MNHQDEKNKRKFWIQLVASAAIGIPVAGILNAIADEVLGNIEQPQDFDSLKQYALHIHKSRDRANTIKNLKETVTNGMRSVITHLSTPEPGSTSNNMTTHSHQSDIQLPTQATRQQQLANSIDKYLEQSERDNL